MDFVPVGSVVLHASRSGDADAPPIVLVNPAGADMRVWARLVPYLENRAHVIRFDQRGHGLSDAGPDGFGIENLADDLGRLLDQLDAGPAILCGVELGALTALALSRRRPPCVAGLVLVAAAAGDPAASRRAHADHVRRVGVAAIADEVLAAWFGRAFLDQRTAEARGWRNMLVRTPAQIYAAASKVIDDARAGPLLREAATVPALCLVGEFEGAAAREDAQAFAHRLGADGPLILGGCAQLAAVAQPAALAARLSDFIARAGRG